MEHEALVKGTRTGPGYHHTMEKQGAGEKAARRPVRPKKDLRQSLAGLEPGRGIDELRNNAGDLLIFIWVARVEAHRLPHG